MKLKISVLTTVYNGERFIEETIKSVLNQTFKDFEYIIVDDGSTDNTREIIRKYEIKDKRVVYHSGNVNQGYYNFHNSINYGLDLCKGEFLKENNFKAKCVVTARDSLKSLMGNMGYPPKKIVVDSPDIRALYENVKMEDLIRLLKMDNVIRATLFERK